MTETTSEKAHGSHDFIAKIVCLLLALIIWLYVMEVENPDWEEEYTGIPVELANTDEIEIDHDLTIYGGYSNNIDITLRGRRNQLSAITAEDIKATADVSEISEPGEYTLPISISVPDDSELIGSSADSVTVLVDKRDRKTVDLIPKYSGLIIEDGYIQGDPVLSSPTVTVTGPSRYLSGIDHAEVLVPDLGRVTSSVRAYGSVTLIDADGGVVSNPFVTASVSEVSVDIPIYARRTIPLVVEYMYGFYNEDNVEITLDHPTIDVRGDADVINKLDKIVVTTVDEKLYPDDTSFTVKFTLPAGVEKMEDFDEVNITIHHVGTEKRSINIPIGVENILNADGISYELLQSTLTVTLRGDPGELYLVSAENIVAEIDLRSYSGAQSGRTRIPVTLKFTNTKTVYELGEYYVDVMINADAPTE